MRPQNVELLPVNTYVILVHEQYADRIFDFLSRPTSLHDPSALCTFQILKVQVPEGPSKKIRGMSLLLVLNPQRHLKQIPAIARIRVEFMTSMQARWRKMQHESVAVVEPEESGFGFGQTLWKDLEKAGFQVDKGWLRVETYPRNLNGGICLQIEQAFAAENGRPIPEVPFMDERGTIQFTKSRTKYTHRLFVILQKDVYYWGIEGTELLEINVGNQATHEVPIIGLQEENDMKPVVVDGHVPLSRAYYKLEQVWYEYVQPHQYPLSRGAAMDLGAAPGGWVQVLIQLMGLSHVVAVDKAELGSRVQNLPAVITHVRAEMDAARLAPYGPFSVAVCDASVVWSELMPMLLGKVWNKDKEIIEWVFPVVWVITFKLPRKKRGSIQAHMDRIKEQLPEIMAHVRDKVFDNSVNIEYNVLHLMANSFAERTLYVNITKK